MSDEDDVTVDPLTTLTPAWSLPYPASSDPVSLGATNIRDLAIATDAALTGLRNSITQRDSHTIMRTDGINGANGTVINCGPALVPPLAGPWQIDARMMLHLPENYQAYMQVYVYPDAVLSMNVPFTKSVSAGFQFLEISWAQVVNFGPGQYPVMMFSYAGPNPATVTFREMVLTYGTIADALLRTGQRPRVDDLPADVDVTPWWDAPPPPADEVAAAHGIILP